APTLLARDLHEDNLAVSGAVVFELFVSTVITVFATRRLGSRRAMCVSLGLLFPSVALLVAAQSMASLPLLLAGTTITGMSIALGYRGSLQVINEIAPPDKRAEVISSYLVVCFTGNSLPVVGVGILAATFNPAVATIGLALLVSVLALLALAIEIRDRQ